MRSIYIIVFIIVLIQVSVSATQINWVGASGTPLDWDNPVNWDLGRVPVATDSIYSSYGAQLIIPVGYTARAKYMFLLGSLTINPSGQLIIKDGAFDAFGNVTNYGTIKVQNSPREGLYFRTQASDVEFHNFGTILIDQAAEEGLVIWNGQVFTNHNDPALLGEVTITNCGKASLHLLIGIFVNDGILRAGSSTEGLALKIENTLSGFINNACGKTVLLDGFTFSEGSFNNYGFFRQNYDGDNDIDAANTFLANFASIEDVQKSFTDLDFDLQHIWTPKLFADIRTGDTTEFFIESLPSGFVISDVFTDALLTTNAGPVDAINNTWVPNANANGLTRFYYEIDDNSNCRDTVRFDVSAPVIPVTYWVGPQAGSWQFGFNWSTGSVPTINDYVAIYNPGVTVTIPLGFDAFARTLELRGNLTIGTLASLELDGQGDYVGINTSADGSVLINNGMLKISNVDNGIHGSNASITNNNSISFFGVTNDCIDIRTYAPGSSDLTNNGSIQNDGGNLIFGDHSSIVNNGTLIANQPLVAAINSGNLTNYGVITITGMNQENIGLQGDFYNQNGASITVSNLDQGLHIHGGENYGEIFVQNCDDGIYLDGNWDNFSTEILNIENCNRGIYHEEGDFTNHQAAHIRIRNSAESGFAQTPFLSQTKFYNQGFLEISDSGIYGFECVKDVYNQSSGKITIRNSGHSGLNLFATSADFNNEDQALVEIKNSTQYGILMQGGDIHNLDDGHIIIDTALLAGIFVDELSFGGVGPGVFTNSSIIKIGEDFPSIGIDIQQYCSFINNACNGKVYNFGGFANSGTFTNDGIYRHLSININNSPSPVFNNGIIYDPNNAIPPSNISNLNVVIQEKSGLFDEEEVVTSFLNINYPLNASFQIESSFYLEEHLLTLGGLFNSSTNEFEISNAAVDSSAFYFRIKAAGCASMSIDTFMLPLENTIKPICKNIFWNGGKGLWTDASKWDIGRLPSSCDQVSILGALDSVNVHSPNTITLNAIQNAGFLQISPTSQLNLVGSASHGLRNQGKLVNNGTLQIVNPTLNGYLGEPHSIFNNNGTLNILNASQAAIRIRDFSILNQKGIMNSQ